MPRYRPRDWREPPDWWLVAALLLPVVVGAWTWMVVAIQKGQP